MALYQAMVKSVLSGDTVILHNVNNPKQERILSLAFVSAPRIRREGDEPFAFESREFLRRILVGKVVQFKVLYTIPTSKRDYGIISLPGGLMLPDAAIAEGWVKLRDDADRKNDADSSQAIVQKLEVLEARAKADSKGVWSESPSRLETSYDLPDAKGFVEQNKGKDIDSIVEKVLSGDRLIARLLLSPTKHVQTMALIAGIRAPSTKRVNPSDGKEQPAEPFGDEAQQFIESRLLQRTIKFTPLGVSPQNQIVGSVKHPQRGNVAPFLLEAGLARCMDQHTTLLGAEMGKLRQAERTAKENRAGVFQGHVAPKQNTAGAVEVVVSRVQSADTLFLRNKAGAEKRVNLSSVRQPKPSDPKQAPWQAEAKEFLRKRLIGKHVKVRTDGKRPPSDGYEEREMATVTFNDKNIALLLVENGYASVIRHRADDSDRSPIYDDLLLAEQDAQQEGRGMWAAKPPATKAYVDYSESLEKAKRQLTLLSRQRKVPAIVDFVKSGSRFTVLVPRENAKLTFVLSGIRAPRSARNPSEKSEPFGQEAHDFANKRCQQRDVEIDVEDCDKVGGFIGTLYVNRESFAKVLVEEGLASVHAYSAEKSGNATELFAAEKKAKEARKGMWHSWDPSQDEEDEGTPFEAVSNGANGSGESAERRKDFRDVMVTHVDEDTCRLKLQEVGAGTTALTDLMNAFRSFHLNKSNDRPIEQVKAGDFVSAKFTEDDEWYRAKIRRNDREAKKVEVLYIDYGNSETIPYSRLRPLDAKFSTQSLKGQAVDAVLSFTQFPTSADYLRDAVDFIGRETAGRQMVANVDHVQDNTLYVTLFDVASNNSTETVNADIIAGGYAMVPRKLKAWERSASDILKALKTKEDEAKDERRGIWEYGDLTED
ncbi:nuclease domain-containing protein 1 [Diplodia corticola]|uniref:Probable endonuclease LCL3 n=1 Tax=Diplodia corticola TaxID=236234 RepID=A0A1J9R4D6_9PEZI|nr:nuclease domain-containing protein 1 [Diplodia corticola]OJD35090.1 nuclease domain-containing protein 1 [Diplodia corticola]